jgi:uncharacterized membrane protein
VERCEAIRSAHGIEMAGNAGFVWSNPGAFAKMAVRTIASYRKEYLAEFVGNLGWVEMPLPGWIVWSYISMLVFVALTQTRQAAMNWTQRWLLVSVFAVYAASLFIMVWTFEMPKSYVVVSEVLSGPLRIEGVQGRYFIGFAFPLFVALSFARFHRWEQYMTGLACAFIAVANSVALWLVLAGYYLHPA